MKRFFSFIILLFISFVGVFHNPMMVFSMYQMDMGEKHNMNCDIINNENNQKCNMTCCLDTTNIQANSVINNHSFKQILKYYKIKIILHFISIDYYKQNNKNIITQNKYPPKISKNITRYGYHSLTSIIKSNI